MDFFSSFCCVIDQDSEDSLYSTKTYFAKMPSPCFVSQRRQDIDRQDLPAIGSIIGGVLTLGVTGQFL